MESLAREAVYVFSGLRGQLFRSNRERREWFFFVNRLLADKDSEDIE